MKIIVEKILGKASHADLSGLTIDRVFFDHETLRKGHQRTVSVSGREVFISLDHGDDLYTDALLYRDNAIAIIADMYEEEVIEFMPLGNKEWAEVAYGIGNMHMPAYLYEHRIMTPYNESAERLAGKLKVKWKRCKGKLDGIRADGMHPHNHGESL